MSWLQRVFGGPKIQPTVIQTAAELRSLIEGFEGPILVDVWSPNCAPCRKLIPVMTELATRHEGRVKVAAINVASADRDLVGSLGVMATPTVLIFAKGEEFGRVKGYRPPSWFHEMIDVEFPV